MRLRRQSADLWVVSGDQSYIDPLTSSCVEPYNCSPTYYGYLNALGNYACNPCEVGQTAGVGIRNTPLCFQGTTLEIALGYVRSACLTAHSTDNKQLVWHNGVLDPVDCLLLCAAGPYEYCMTEAGGTCYIGNTNNFNFYAPSNSDLCTTPCLSPSPFTCGGSSSMEVYELNWT